ncbi:MAG: tyrosine-type recombinase/integrase [Candidatus Woesearchaeota archaeon]
MIDNFKRRRYVKGKYKIFPEGKIDAKRIQTWPEIRTRLESNKDEFHPDNVQTTLLFLRAAKNGKTNPNKQYTKVGMKRLLKFIQDLKKLDHYFKKPFKDITEKEMERFIKDLEDGVIKSPKGTPYAPETQAVIKKLIRKFYKWLEGNGNFYPEKVQGIHTAVKLKDYEVITLLQHNRIMTLLTSNTSYNLVRNKAVLSFGFDSGMRAEEIINTRLKHLSFKDEVYYVRIEHHKHGSKKRTILLPICKPYLEAWLSLHDAIPDSKVERGELFPPNTPLDAQLFINVDYNKLRLITKRAGLAIGKKLTPHGLRHASATHYCQQLTPYELCYRFGWSMSSRMPARYIDQEGIGQGKPIKMMRVARLESLEAENAKLAEKIVTMEAYFKRFFKEDETEARKIINMMREMRGISVQ